MAARNRGIEPGWGFPDDEETFQKHRETMEDQARELGRHDVDEALQTLQTAYQDILSEEYFAADYREDLDSFRQVDRLRENVLDAITEMVQHSYPGTVNAIGLEIKRMRARRRLQKDREAFARMTPERREKAEKKLEEARKSRYE